MLKEYSLQNIETSICINNIYLCYISMFCKEWGMGNAPVSSDSVLNDTVYIKIYNVVIYYLYIHYS